MGQITKGNVLSLFISTLEQLCIAGLWTSWPQLTVYLKTNNFYAGACHYTTPSTVTNETTLDCSQRDANFNRLYTNATSVYLFGVFILGMLTDRYGLVFGRCVAGGITSTGLFTLSMVLYRTLSVSWLWLAWPCLALGGQLLHTMNIRACRAVPFISATTMSFYAGCLQSGASMIFIYDNLAQLLNVRLADVILGLAFVYTINAIINLTFFTPVHIETSTTSISLHDKAYIHKRFCNRETSESGSMSYKGGIMVEKPREKSSTAALFKDKNLWLLVLAVLPWELRKGSHMSWLGAGWPSWVNGGDDVGFEYELTKLQGLSLLSLMVLNILPGLVVDAMRHKYAKPYNANYGAALGLSLSMVVSVTLLIVNSCLNAQRSPDLAKVSVVLHAVARLFGVGVWNPAFFYLFPSDQYGVVYGINTMSMLPSAWMMIPLYNYVQTHDMDFATINYAIAVFCGLTYLLPVAICNKTREIKRIYSKE